MSHSRHDRDMGDFARRCLIVSACAVGLAMVFWFFWRMGSALLLLFTAFLMAVSLDALARVFSQLVGLPRRASVMAVLLIFAVLIASTMTLSTLNVSSRAPELKHKIEESVDALRDKLDQYHISEQLFSGSGKSGASTASQTPRQIGEYLTQRVSGALTLTLSTLIDLFIVVVIGLYLALSPDLYYKGLLRLFPPASQHSIDIIAHESVDAIRRWLAGRALAMCLVGIGSIIGLSLIGVQFPVLLGTLAGTLTFIPYLGAIISTIPALLVAGLNGLWPMVYVAVLYLSLHAIEAYVLTPLIQRRAASIAPAFLLSVQVIGGAVAGVIGIALAAPIALVLTVIIQLGYVQGMIGEEPHLPISMRRRRAHDDDDADL